MFESFRDILKDPIYGLLVGCIVTWAITKLFDRFPNLVAIAFNPLKRCLVRSYVREFNTDVTAMKRGLFVYSYLHQAILLMICYVTTLILFGLIALLVNVVVERLPRPLSDTLYWIFMIVGAAVIVTIMLLTNRYGRIRKLLSDPPEYRKSLIQLLRKIDPEFAGGTLSQIPGEIEKRYAIDKEPIKTPEKSSSRTGVLG